MASGAVFTLVYLRILPTTKRSKFGYVVHCACHYLTSSRILIASIRNLGRCPCPRCLIPLDRMAKMGRRRDMTQRQTLARTDDVKRRNRVETARELIYRKNYGISSKAVERLLQEDSLVPTAVCISFLAVESFDSLVPERLFEQASAIWF
jgi:hypothetical protein